MEVSDADEKAIDIVPRDASPVRIIRPSQRPSGPGIPGESKIRPALRKRGVMCDPCGVVDYEFELYYIVPLWHLHNYNLEQGKLND